MSGQGAQIALIVWRESVEALLVIGILDCWLRNADAESRRRGRRMLWAGVLAGVLLALLLAALLVLVGDSLQGDEEAWFRTATVLVAAGLIVQMVLWMRANGASLGRALGARMSGSVRAGRWWGVCLLAAIAVAREGSETVAFIYGVLAAGGRPAQTVAGVTAIGSGFAAAGVSYALLAYGSRVVSWRLFFRASEIMLLLLASALVVAGASELIGLDILPALSGPLWDTSWLMDDYGPVGGLISALTGYRSRPEAMLVIVFGAYWAFILWVLSRPGVGKRADGATTAAT